ncbi:catalase [Branchiibius cervicis]|uniref:Catalase n=1 Tax=Branchiibius cervicis TaxID=908252 RepID=A0ABW2AR55_9MICO
MATRKKNDRPLAPGAPASERPALSEPARPRGPLPPKPDQAGPDTVTATGVPTGVAPEAVAQQGKYLTTAHGTRLRDSDHSLRAGARGPALLQDHHLREKVSHFDHERIPERVVHARGAAAHGTFVANGAARNICAARFLRRGASTPVFVRFSTVLGSRGSADLARDTRGFATRFYTDEGNYDLVGNNIPVFFIQDGIKFPDVIHAGKPHPDREIPQAQSAHDTFWDFVSLHTEAQAHTIWNMSDRGLPRSFRTMEGFGVHTFRLANAKGDTSLVKFHWKPRLGVHSVTWEEAQLASGADPDYHRRDLADAIEAGAYPQWDLGVQVMPDDQDGYYEGIDLLDPTKFVPEEQVPVQVIGTMTLDRNPTNYFAETEQVAFNPANLVPGIDVTNDPLLQARLFSYLDTQLTRLGGPNWNQLPINRAHVPINDMLRDGFHQSAVHGGVAPYRPNSLDGGCPFTAGAKDGAFIEVPETVAESVKERRAPTSFDDHFSQVSLFYRSMTPVEQDHIVAAYSFELAKCFEEPIRVRQLAALANVDAGLCARVAQSLGLDAPEATVPPADQEVSPALSQVGGRWPLDGRQVGVVIGEDSPAKDVSTVLAAFDNAGVTPLVVAAHGGTVAQTTVQRTFATAASIEFDALVVVGAPGPAPDAQPSVDAKAGAAPAAPVDPRVVKLLQETWRHCKAIAAVGDPTALEVAGVSTDAPGVSVGTADEVTDGVLAGLAMHRAWERFPAG